MDVYRLGEKLKNVGKYKEAIEKFAIIEHNYPSMSIEAGLKKGFSSCQTQSVTPVIHGLGE